MMYLHNNNITTHSAASSYLQFWLVFKQQWTQNRIMIFVSILGRPQKKKKEVIPQIYITLFYTHYLYTSRAHILLCYKNEDGKYILFLFLSCRRPLIGIRAAFVGTTTSFWSSHVCGVVGQNRYILQYPLYIRRVKDFNPNPTYYIRPGRV
jgi:hypothetical protein